VREVTEVRKMDWKKYVGKRVLVRQGWVRFARDLGPTEVEVLEVSRSGEYVKFKYPNTGHTSWVKAGDVEFVECLDEVEVLEVSSSREYVKFKYPNTWVKVDDVEFVECLDEYPNIWVKVDDVEFVECLDEGDDENGE